jgi:tetratricopeptide (TPR) repeat protein
VARGVYKNAVYPEPEPLKRDLLPEEVQARLDYRGGLDKYHRDDVWRDNVVEHFRFNVQRIVSRCQHAGVPIWIVDPTCNLRDCPPFKSEPGDDLQPSEMERWNQLRDQASDLYRTDMAKALDLLKKAVAIDDQHAGLWYDVAKCYESIGQFDLARDAYLRSKELDICPLRIIEPLRDVLLEIARATDTTVIPVHDLFVERCEHGIPGGFLLVDHVHPSISGHQMVAELMVDEMISQGFAKPRGDWKAARDQRYQEHTATLKDAYYFDGQRRLRGLQSWAQGRSTREK